MQHVCAGDAAVPALQRRPVVPRAQRPAAPRNRDPAAAPAFTLVELLVVMGVLAVLAALLFPVFARVKARAYLTRCTSNARQIGVAVKLYAQDYDDWFPYARTVDSGPSLADAPTLKEALDPYLKNRDVWFCSSWLAKHGDLMTGSRSLWRLYDATYGYNAFPERSTKTLFGKRLGDILHPAVKPMVWCASGCAHSHIDADQWAAGAVGAVNVCYVDGHVKLFRGTLRQFTAQVYAGPS